MTGVLDNKPMRNAKGHVTANGFAMGAAQALPWQVVGSGSGALQA